MSADKNQKTYSTRSIVHYYTQLKQLQPAEQSILDLLKQQLPAMKMLDMGVGGGRTTQHFAQLAKEYIGIDYSADMIAACQQRFRTAQFAVCDARNMSQFQDNSFDFILFSFNGIDYVSHDDRLQILQEVRRVGKPGGYFCFSSHNLQGIERAFHWRNQLSLNPITSYTNLVMLALLRGFNYPITQKRLKTTAYTMIRDESHNFRLQTYYIRPEEQLKQLEGFRDVKVYPWRSGQEISSQDALELNTDMWLYYLCTIS